MDEFMRTRFPFCSRYTLNPRLCASPPVFHISTVRFAPFLSAPENAENDCNVIPVGKVMVSVGVPVFTIATSALFALATIAVALAMFVVILGTALAAVAVAVSVMLVPDGVPVFTRSTTLKVAVLPAPTPRLPLSVQVMVPVPPTAGTVPQVHPAGGVIDWKVGSGGGPCVTVIPAAATAGPSVLPAC